MVSYATDAGSPASIAYRAATVPSAGPLETLFVQWLKLPTTASKPGPGLGYTDDQVALTLAAIRSQALATQAGSAALPADPSQFPPLDAASIVTNAEGAVCRLYGGGYVAASTFFAIEPDRIYDARLVVGRSQNAADPSGDDVRFGAFLYDANKTLIGPVTLMDYPQLTVAAGAAEGAVPRDPSRLAAGGRDHVERRGALCPPVRRDLRRRAADRHRSHRLARRDGACPARQRGQRAARDAVRLTGRPMREPGTYDFTINRGSTEPLVIRLRDQTTGNLLDLTGADVTLDIDWCGLSIRKSISAGGLTWDAVTCNIAWAPSAAESLSIPEGRLASYVYAVSFAGGPIAEPYLEGFMIGRGHGGG